MPPKTIIFVRHGEAEHNRAYHESGKDEKVFYDEKYRDAPLTEKGKRQAIEVGEKLAAKYPNANFSIWSSPLTRAIQTAEEIFEEVATSGQVMLHDGLLEFQDGKHKCNQRIAASDLKEKYFICDTVFLPELPAFWFVSEPHVHLKHRMKSVIQTIVEVERGENIVVVVSHRNALAALLDGASFENCSFVEKSVEELLHTTNSA